LPYFETQGKQLKITRACNPAPNQGSGVAWKPEAGGRDFMLPPPKFLFAAAGFFRLHWRRFFKVHELDD